MKNGLSFENGSSFFFSVHNPDLIKQMIAGIQSSPEMFCGLKVAEIIIQEDPDLSGRNRFHVASPVFIKRRNGDKIDHILYNDERAGEYLKETLQTKLKEGGITDDTFDVKFDLEYHKAGTKMIKYIKGNQIIKNRCSWCPVIIEGKPETKTFAWNVGIGNSTGIGFGAIK